LYSRIARQPGTVTVVLAYLAALITYQIATELGAG
jgi:hypothetical protein